MVESKSESEGLDLKVLGEWFGVVGLRGLELQLADVCSGLDVGSVWEHLYITVVHIHVVPYLVVCIYQ